ncbi:WecB/TagA/CpsF family glycosyltransferase [Treponema sp. OMZ 840]|uniref:WecB/TagA/CpsF family glycosyltransferase n=1 Tax=Treponema sp. OMZ 840 TaxID=244313 RepID=UPI003D93CACF
MEVERIRVAGVPVDIIRPEHLEQALFELLAASGTKQIVFLSVWNLLKARGNAEYKLCLENASLVLPISKSIVNGAVFLKKTKPIRYNPFSAIISFFTILETRYKSLYLLGGHKSTLIESERNLHATFPDLHIVGRYTGYFSKDTEKDVLSAIFKANPSMVLLSDGIPSGVTWPYVRRNSFGSSIFVYYKDALSVFSKRKKRVPNEVFDAGHEIWSEILSNPLKIFLVFPFIWYIIILIWDRLSSKT